MQQYDKQHAITAVAAAPIAAYRFVGYDGTPATGAGGLNDSRGASESAAAIGAALAVITSYSALVEAGGNFAYGDYVKPGPGGVAVIGSALDHCGRALSDASLGAIVEIEIQRHIHP